MSETRRQTLERLVRTPVYTRERERIREKLQRELDQMKEADNEANSTQAT